jgi:hypothetical protein
MISSSNTQKSKIRADAAIKIATNLKKLFTQKSKKRADAAIKIATNLKKLFRSRKQKSDSCIVKPITISASNADNILICMKKDKDEIPLVDIFTFKQTVGISDKSFFINFYHHMLERIEQKKIIVASTEILIFPDILIKITETSDKGVDYLEIEYNIGDSNVDSNYLLPFICYILKNTHIDLKIGIVMRIEHPFNFSNIAGIHKDDCIYTCITYINSIVTTEIAFDVEKIQLDWLTCSPLFRFDTLGKLCTLCFRDKYILHSIPIYEEEGKRPSQLNEFEGNDMIEKIDENGNPIITFLSDRYIFSKQLHRKKIQHSTTKRIILGCFFYPVENYATDFSDKLTEKILIRKDDMEKYKIKLMQEKIELSQDTVESIRTSANIGSFDFKGGQHKKTKKNKKVVKTQKNRKCFSIKG